MSDNEAMDDLRGRLHRALNRPLIPPENRVDAVLAEVAHLLPPADGLEAVWLPPDVVDKWASGWGLVAKEPSTQPDALLVLGRTVDACRAAEGRRSKPAPETERVRAMEAVEDRRMVSHPASPFEAEAIMWIEGEMAVCEYGGRAAPIGADGTVEVLKVDPS